MHSIDILTVEDNDGDFLLNSVTLLEQKIVYNIQVIQNGMDAINDHLKMLSEIPSIKKPGLFINQGFNS